MVGKIGCIIILAGFLIFPDLTMAKVYIWKDKENRTHYCNDPDDVPKEFRENCRIIESPASQAKPNPIPPPTSTTTRTAPAMNPDGVSRELAEELEQLMKEYKDKRQAIQAYRKSHKDTRTPEYEELKRQLIEIKKRLNQARKRATSKSP